MRSRRGKRLPTWVSGARSGSRRILGQAGRWLAAFGLGGVLGLAVLLALGAIGVTSCTAYQELRASQTGGRIGFKRFPQTLAEVSSPVGSPEKGPMLAATLVFTSSEAGGDFARLARGYGKLISDTGQVVDVQSASTDTENYYRIYLSLQDARCGMCRYTHLAIVIGSQLRSFDIGAIAVPPVDVTGTYHEDPIY